MTAMTKIGDLVSIPELRPMDSAELAVAAHDETRWMQKGTDTHADLLMLNTHPDQRKMRTDDQGAKVFRYFRAMETGQWRVGADSGICLGRVGARGTYRLLNGQHRLEAGRRAAENGIYIPFQLHYYTFDSETQLSEFFAAMDQVFNRTTSQRLQILGIGDELSLPSTWLRDAAASVRLIDADFKPYSQRHALNTVEASAVANALRGTKNGVYAYYKASMGSEALSAAFRRTSVFAVGLVTFYYQPEKASEFWNEVGDPKVLIKGSPIMTLRDYLLTTKVGNNVHGDNPSVYAKRVARAWNAYFDGRDQITALRNVQSDKPIEIKGTDFNGTRTGIGPQLVIKWIAEGRA